MRKLAVLVFIDYQLGGIGTQAVDFTRLAREHGFAADLITFTASKKPREAREPGLAVARDGKGLELQACMLSVHPERQGASLSRLAEYDLRLWVGVAPHCKPGDQVYGFFEATLRQLPGRNVAFATDRFVNDLYSWVIPHLHRFTCVTAFADAYAATLRAHGIPVDVVPLAPLDAWDQRRLVLPSRKPRQLFWPHQWRGWKNISMFLESAGKLEVPEINVYASGAGFEYSAFRRSDAYSDLVRSDRHNPSHFNPRGRLNLLGFVPHATVLQAYRDHAATPDLTGISSKRHTANSYVGNYQCATLEAMCFGCAVLKMETTVAPYSAIPREAVAVLRAGAADYAAEMNVALRGGLDSAAEQAFAWIERSCDPYQLFGSIVGES